MYLNSIKRTFLCFCVFFFFFLMSSTTQERKRKKDKNLDTKYKNVNSSYGISSSSSFTRADNSVADPIIRSCNNENQNVLQRSNARLTTRLSNVSNPLADITNG